MKASPNEPLTLAFVGYATHELAKQAAAFEDEVLPLIEEHGARLLYRGRRTQGQDGALPFEIHLLWFPDREVLESYLADGRRQKLLQTFGEVFSLKQLVQIETIKPITPPP